MRLNRTDAGFVLVILVTVVVFASFIYRPGPIYGPATTTSATSTSQVSATQPLQYVRLRVEVGLQDPKWMRNPLTDLPEYLVLLAYVIHNDGNGTADNAHIIIQTDNSVSDEYSVPIPAYDSHDGTIPLAFGYDTTHQIIVEASSSQSSDKAVLNVDATLPRILLRSNETPSDEMLALAELFITPNDSVVQVALNEIWHSPPLSDHCPSGPDPKCPDWFVVGGILHWISANVGYTSENDYAQLPRETLQRSTGDSKDLSILLVSLVRAAGFDENRAFVVLGSNGAACYAWARINTMVWGEWHSFMPDREGFHECTSWQAISGRGRCDLTQPTVPGGYVAVYQFNDVQVKKVLP